MAYISWSSDFALYLEDYLIYVCTSYFGSMDQYDLMFDLKINVVTVTYISWSSDFALHLEDYMMYGHHTLGLWVSMTQRLTAK